MYGHSSLSVCLAKHFIEERRTAPSFLGGTKLAAALQFIVGILFSFALLKAEQNGPRRGCSDAATLQSLQTMSDTSHRPAATKHQGVCRLHSASPSFASPILILLSLVSQDKPLRCSYLATSRRKPQTAAYAMKFEMLRAEIELVEPGSQISRGSCDTFYWGKHGRFSVSSVIMHIKP